MKKYDKITFGGQRNLPTFLLSAVFNASSVRTIQPYKKPPSDLPLGGFLITFSNIGCLKNYSSLGTYSRISSILQLRTAQILAKTSVSSRVTLLLQ